MVKMQICGGEPMELLARTAQHLDNKSIVNMWAKLAQLEHEVRIERHARSRLEYRVLKLEEALHPASAFTSTTVTSNKSVDLEISSSYDAPIFQQPGRNPPTPPRTFIGRHGLGQ